MPRSHVFFRPAERPKVNLFLYFLTVIIWGTTWIAIKLQLGVVAIPVSIFYRFALAGLVLFAVLLLTRKLQRMDRRAHWLCLGQGLCLFCLNFLCFYTATQWIPSGLVSVVFSAATLWLSLIHISTSPAPTGSAAAQ